MPTYIGDDGPTSTNPLGYTPSPGGASIPGTAAGMAGLSGFVSGGLNYLSNREANEQNYQMFRESQAFAGQQADLNRADTRAYFDRSLDFQERMSSTAYQRATEDMKKAGINPMLAYMKGGASTPSGPSASGYAASSPGGNRMESTRLGDAVKESLGTAMQVARFEKEMESMDADIRLRTAQKAATDADKEMTETTALAAKKRLPVVDAEARRDKTHAEIDSKAAWWDAGIERLGNAGSAIGNTIRGLFSGGTGKKAQTYDEKMNEWLRNRPKPRR